MVSYGFQCAAHVQTHILSICAGKLAKSTILNGFSALKALSEVISQPDGDVSKQNGGFRQAVEHLTNRYYS